MERIIFKIPIKTKKWWEFWKKSDRKRALELMKLYKKNIVIKDDKDEPDFFIPTNTT
jgi:hypothetical protein